VSPQNLLDVMHYNSSEFISTLASGIRCASVMAFSAEREEKVCQVVTQFIKPGLLKSIVNLHNVPRCNVLDWMIKDLPMAPFVTFVSREPYVCD